MKTLQVLLSPCGKMLFPKNDASLARSKEKWNGIPAIYGRFRTLYNTSKGQYSTTACLGKYKIRNFRDMVEILTAIKVYFGCAKGTLFYRGGGPPPPAL